MNNPIVSSEMLTEGALNKVCDYIADEILNSYLEKDENSKIVIDIIINNDTLLVIGEISSKTKINIESEIKKQLLKIKFNNYVKNLKVISNIKYDDGNNDQLIFHMEQGIIFGYACDETPELMPASVIYSHQLAKQLYDYIIENNSKFINTCGKVQVNVQYKNNKLSRINSIIIYANYLNEKLDNCERKNLIEKTVKTVITEKLIDNNTKIKIHNYDYYSLSEKNSTIGVSGRNNFSDLYGAHSRYVFCPLSGRGPNKIERSATLMARFIAKNIVATGLIDKVEIGLNYELGTLEPSSIMVNSYGKQFDSGLIDTTDVIYMIKKLFPLNIVEIIKLFDLNNFRYSQISRYGYFGNSNFPWEKLDYVKKIKEYFTKEKGMIFL